jgi:hypothetical protein
MDSNLITTSETMKLLEKAGEMFQHNSLHDGNKSIPNSNKI